MFELHNLSGKLSQVDGLVGVLSLENNLKGTLTVGDLTVIGGKEYEGEYEATPDTEPIILPTKDRVLKEDITVFKIPLWEVSNPTNGTTVYIGGKEVYGNI